MSNLQFKIKNISVSLKFFGLVILAYFILLIFNFNIWVSSLEKFVALAIKILPSLLGAFVLIFIFNFLLNNQQIKKYLTSNLNWRKYFLVIILGILSSGPIYAWYPFLADLKEQGFRNSLITIFLYNRAIKLPFIPLLVYYFSLEFVILITILMIIFSVVNGWVLEKIVKN